MLNSVILMGRLTANPELKTTASNISVTSITLAVERNTKDRTTDFIDVVAWKNTAEFVSRYFKKGQLVAVQGSLQVRSYEDKNGNKHRVYEVQAEQMFFAERKTNDERSDAGGNRSAAPSGSQYVFTPVSDDDLPFR